MGWSIGFSHKHNRDIGYGVPAICDHPDCDAEIHRGIDYVCGDEPYGGEYGCGLHFCHDHLHFDGDRSPQMCERCRDEKPEFSPKPDCEEWIQWKLRDNSWQQWREEHPDEVAVMRDAITS